MKRWIHSATTQTSKDTTSTDSHKEECYQLDIKVNLPPTIDDLDNVVGSIIKDLPNIPKSERLHFPEIAYYDMFLQEAISVIDKHLGIEEQKQSGISYSYYVKTSYDTGTTTYNILFRFSDHPSKHGMQETEKFKPIVVTVGKGEYTNWWDAKFALQDICKDIAENGDLSKLRRVDEFNLVD